MGTRAPVDASLNTTVLTPGGATERVIPEDVTLTTELLTQVSEGGIAIFGVWWDVFIIVCGILFSCIILWAIINLVFLHIRREIISSPVYHLTLNIMMFLVGVSVLASYIIIQIGSLSVHNDAIYVLIHFPIPCLACSFYLLFSVMRRMTQMKVIGGRLFTTSFIITLVIFNFTLAIIADVVTALYIDAVIAVIICRCYYILFSVMVAIGYLHTFITLYQSAVTNRKRLVGLEMSSHDMSTISSSENGVAKKTRKGVHTSAARGNPQSSLTVKVPIGAKITLVAAWWFLLLMATNAYDLLATIIYFDGNRLNTQTWYLQSFLVPWYLCQIAMAMTILFVSSLPIFK